MTGIKASNIPLALPWLMVVCLNGRAFWKACRPGWLIGTGLAGALVSFLPSALLNIHFSGNYTGDPANVHGLQARNPVAGIVGNSLELAASNLLPPIWPREIAPRLPPAIERYVLRGFPRFAMRHPALELEEDSALGIGVSLFTALCLIYGLRARLSGAGRRRQIQAGAGWIALATAVAWLGYMGKMGSEAGPRLMAVYYIIGIGVMLAVLQIDGTSVHRRVWRVAACAVLAIVFPVLILYPGRPLLPVAVILQGLRTCGVPAAAVERLGDYYRNRPTRVDSLKELRLALPETEKAVGLVENSDDPEVSLWMPFGSRQVVELDPKEPRAELDAKQIRYVVVSEFGLRELHHMSVADLAKKWSMRVILRQGVVLKTAFKTENWYLLSSASQQVPPK
jgi:hypothetical protein